MNTQQLGGDMNTYSYKIENEDKQSVKSRVRAVMLESFSSKFFLTIIVLYTLSFIFSFIMLFMQEFNIIYFLSLIIPLILIVGFWITYNNAKAGRVLDTTGLRLIKGVMTFSFIILLASSSLLFIIGGYIHMTFVKISIPIGIISFVYYVFKRIVSYIIDSFELGSYITNYYNAAFMFLIISAVITFIGAILTYTGKLEYALRSVVNIDSINYSTPQIILGALGSACSFLFLTFLAAFIFKLNTKVDGVQRYYGYDGKIINENTNMLD